VVHWREGLPGRGSGGRAPSAARQDYFLSGLQPSGLDQDEPQHGDRRATEEFPELTEAQLYGWLIESWS